MPEGSLGKSIQLQHDFLVLCSAVSISKRLKWSGICYISGIARDTAVNKKTVACLDSFTIRCGRDRGSDQCTNVTFLLTSRMESIRAREVQ